MRDVLLDAERKRQEAEAMRRLVQSSDYAILAELIDAFASAYVNQLINPVPEDWKSHYLRGLIKGLDEAKTLPLRVVRAYDKEREEAEKRPTEDNPRPGMRLSPEPGDVQ